MKLRVQKKLLFRVLHWYTEKLTEKFLGHPMNLPTIYKMQDFLKALQQQKQAEEPMNTVWQVPVEVKIKENSAYVELADETNVLIME